MTLVRRDVMGFRMLLGRRAMGGNTVVVPDASYLNGRMKPKKLYALPNKNVPTPDA